MQKFTVEYRFDEKGCLIVKTDAGWKPHAGREGRVGDPMECLDPPVEFVARVGDPMELAECVDSPPVEFTIRFRSSESGESD